ncbi:PQQ-dependent catabolism-associated CXXCW motif protein [Mangrovicoccus sp. HB182678]|uniref:PQQ-dependent catabolism-associated CXXCW motif protein n=1 Tax=Mangrovicoccus algicola TaxID=2771008 RepID=A0A8J6YWD0_9RHOB|nr:PQQ-dependent catabolism-associated CXXCW motif protein [Mangrovicoccus algicola]
MRALACLLVLAGRAAAGEVPEPAGYRMQDYRAPVPATLAGAQVLDAAAAHALWQAGQAAFVDVLPRPVRPGTLPEGTIWRDPPRPSIPGATWLANSGYGDLAPADAERFLAALEALSGGDPAHPLVFFCKAECWMSWNAARRALAAGHRSVMWFPGGTDDWAAAGHPLAPATPAPGF